MKTFSDRIWLVLLGIAVAVVVLLTTFYWNKPGQSRSSEVNSSTASHSRAVLPWLGTEVLKSFKPRPSVRNN